MCQAQRAGWDGCYIFASNHTRAISQKSVKMRIIFYEIRRYFRRKRQTEKDVRPVVVDTSALRFHHSPSTETFF